MNKSLFHRRRAERFAQLLEEANGGRRHHVREAIDTELAELTAIAQKLPAAAPPAEPGADFRTGLRAMLVATAEREGIGATAEQATATQPGAGRRLLRPALNPRRARTRGAIVVGIAFGAIAVSGISAASENAMPGDTLYPMKRSAERAQLVLTGSDLNRGELFLAFARTRLAEAGAAGGDSAGFAAVLDDMDRDTRQGVKVLTGTAVQRTDPAALDSIGSFIEDQRRGVTRLLDSRPVGDRDRVETSLALLDAIEQRAAELRTALPCMTGLPAGNDALGPRPAACAPNGQPSAVATKPARIGPGTPAPTTDPAGPGASPTPGVGHSPGEAGNSTPTGPASPPATEQEDLLSNPGRLPGGVRS